MIGQAPMPGERLNEEWSIYSFLNMVGHLCHRGTTYWMWDPQNEIYVCPACKEGMPESLVFLSRVLLR